MSLYVYDLLHHFFSPLEDLGISLLLLFSLLLFFSSAKGQSSKVVLGAHSLSKDEASKQTFEIIKFIPHSRFASDPESYDIMLVKVRGVASLQFARSCPARSR